MPPKHQSTSPPNIEETTTVDGVRYLVSFSIRGQTIRGLRTTLPYDSEREKSTLMAVIGKAIGKNAWIWPQQYRPADIVFTFPNVVAVQPQDQTAICGPDMRLAQWLQSCQVVVWHPSGLGQEHLVQSCLRSRTSNDSCITCTKKLKGDGWPQFSRMMKGFGSVQCTYLVSQMLKCNDCDAAGRFAARNQPIS